MIPLYSKSLEQRRTLVSGRTPGPSSTALQLEDPGHLGAEEGEKNEGEREGEIK